jgi:uncharacterized protein (TIGR03067 family)
MTELSLPIGLTKGDNGRTIAKGGADETRPINTDPSLPPVSCDGPVSLDILSAVRPFRRIVMGIKPILLAMLILPAAAGLQAQDVPKKVEMPLPSQWELVYAEFQGEKFKDPTKLVLNADGTGTLRFSGDDFTFKYEVTPKTDPLKMDLAMSWVGHRNVPAISHASIYRYDGVNLTLCMAWAANAERPTDFSTSTGDGRLLLVLKQKKV